MMLTWWDQHLVYFEDALAKNDRGDFAGALASWDEALKVRETAHARWNRGQALLSLGRYVEGFRDYAVRFELFPNMLNEGCQEIRQRLPLWQGEDIAGKQLVLLGEQGYGDVIMLARYVRLLVARGIDVVLAVPPALHRLLRQLAPIGRDGDLCCPFFDVMLHLGPTVPSGAVLQADPALRADWAGKLEAGAPGEATSGELARGTDSLPHPRRIGVAWKAGRPEHIRDFKRSMWVGAFVRELCAHGHNGHLVALQPNDCDEARELGITVPDYTDFADVAAVASLMDEIVCTDVAAINVAGAIGHPNAHVLLPYVSSWRWLGANVWYPHVHRCQQTAPGDWASAFAQLDQ